MRSTLAISILLGCNGGSAKVADTTDGGGTALGDADADTDADTDSDADSDADSDPNPDQLCFEEDVVPLMNRSCGSGENACHSAIAYGASAANNCYGWLSLEDRPLGSTNPSTGAPTGCPDLELYARLTELASWECFISGDGTSPSITLPYVTPGDPSQSYLWWKVDPGGTLCDMEPGVPSERMPLAAELPQADLDLLEQWITEGAQLCGSTTTANGPSCEITSPADLTELDFRQDFAFRATASGTVTWSIGATVLGTGTSIDVALPVSGWSTVTCTATDTQGNTATDTVEVRAISPIVEIWHPGDGETRELSNGPFPFQSYAEDLEDGELTLDVQWTDDGTWFGSGTGFDYLPTGVGLHVIEAAVIDSDGNLGSTSITLDMVP